MGNLFQRSSGQYVVTGTNNGHGIWVSSDFGQSWSETRAPNYNTYVDVTMDSSGINLAALMSNGTIYSSSNGGAYWQEYISPIIFNSLATSGSYVYYDNYVPSEPDSGGDSDNGNTVIIIGVV
eukprot:gene24636-31003_t